MVAANLGADLLGFNFYPQSPRHISLSECKAICCELAKSAPQVMRVGVFVNLPPAEVRGILDLCGLQLAQLSGDESLSDLMALEGQAFKALRLSSDSFFPRQVQADSQTRIDVDAYLGVRMGVAPVGLVDAAVQDSSAVREKLQIGRWLPAWHAAVQSCWPVG